ncbi:MAG: hypothetical protein JWM19_601 [Actinomycetia bacterium]|nr:hypothetical protein [Actinomycetes bacterium]
MRAVIYCRISKDRNGEALGVDRQEQDCRELAERLGWKIVAVFIDNDISASTRSRKPRPEYEAMLRAVRAGQVDAILAYSNSRLTRRAAEWMTLIELANAGQVRIKTVVSGEQDLSTADGRAVALTIAAWDAAEAERTGERKTRAVRQAAEAGKYRGGLRPYGFEADGLTVRESEAKVIREKSSEVLAGRSMRSLAKELNDRGLTTSTGKPWTHTQLTDVLIRPRNAGLVHTGLPRGEFEIIGPAQWPAIVDEDTWRAVHAILTAPARRTGQSNASRWLGTGTYTCGVAGCGARMRAGLTSGREGASPGYRCSEKNHLTIAAVPADEHVRRAVAELVRDPRIIAALTEGKASEAIAADRERRAVLAVRLEAFADDYATGVIDGKQLAKATAKVKPEIEEIDARMASGLQRSAASGVLGKADPGAAFRNAPVDVQRSVLRTVATVTVMPAGRGGRRSAEAVTARIKIEPAVTG